LAAVGASAAPLCAAEPPPHLPQYDVALTLDAPNHRAELRQRVTWTNTTAKPTDQLVYNFYAHYTVPDGDYLLLAKTLELLRLQPSLGIDRGGEFGTIKEARLLGYGNQSLPQPQVLGYEYDKDNMTALRFKLPRAVNPGESVTVELDCTIRLPHKQGRLGQWEGVTYLTNTLPLLAYCDDSGWRPMPFVPWHQPWFNEAGVFRAAITLPQTEVLACPAAVKSETSPAPGWKTIETEPFVGRDFAILASERFREYKAHTQLPDGRTVELRCLAFPEHEFYANEILKIVGEAIPVYSQWFGPFPYPNFTVVESFFGWNGNECAGLIMIDERVFGMPHLARGYVEYLVSHETCHQWWYNMVGTNGYSEPFMDEGAAAYFTHRLLDLKKGPNNELLEWPGALKWLPNIKRDNYRYGEVYFAVRNNQMQPAAQDLPKYGHLIGLFTGAYDRGSKAIGMVEAQLGEAAFLDFIRGIVSKYSWRVLQVADLKRELEAYTGRDWSEFFDRWIYGKGLVDWGIESVRTDPAAGPRLMPITPSPSAPHTTTVIVRQTREYTEPTIVSLTPDPGSGRSGAAIRVPIGLPQPITLDDPPATVEPLGDNRWKVTVTTAFAPGQVEIDPDRVLLDADPGNNVWKADPHVRVTPLYTMLDETDLTTDYNRWNFTAGPWIWGATYPDPWYTRSTMAGLRVGTYRTQEFKAGGYAAYRTDFRDAILGVDVAWLREMAEAGFNWEYRIGGPWGGTEGATSPQRVAAYYRWILKNTSSLYLSPMVYHETFATYQDNFLPFARTFTPGADRWDRSMMWGWHFRANLYTPYWNPEGGFWVDVMAAGGAVHMPDWRETGQFRAELAGVRALPEWTGPLHNVRLAGRVVAMGALPDQGQFFALGGGTLFRGYDLAERQGSMLWVANAEVRVPLAQNVEWDCLDHCVGARGLWLAAFYDVGDVYANGRSVGGRVAHAVGGGLRMDVAIFSFLERATLRFDVAKTINDNTSFQYWFGVQHAF
jgi:hypothetical protein